MSKPRVLIITTGGTIASRPDAPMIDGPALVQAVPQLLSVADIEVEEFIRVGSSKITPAHWLQLARRINELFAADPSLSGIVITHGTDTMEETAFFLNLTVRHARPVVLVGSMRAATEISADGPANLFNAVRVAASPAAAGKGVLVVLNEDVAAARDVWKTDNRRVHTFQSPQLGFLGVADPDTVVFYRETLRPHTVASPFDVSNIDALPRVELLMDYTGFDRGIVDYFAAKGLDGLVIRSFAGGRLSAGATEGIAAATRQGLPIVIASGVPGGRISGTSYDFPVVLAADLPPHKARILLMLALLKTKDAKALQALFDTY